MKSPRILMIDGKKYMSTQTAADLWGVKPRTVSGYCKNNRITNCFKNGKQGWYIWIDEIKPLSTNEIHRILLLTLQLKNRPSLEIDWSTFSFDDSFIEVIYKSLAYQGFIEEFDIENKKKIPYEVILTKKGFEFATSFKNEESSDFTTSLQQWLPIIIQLAQLYLQAIQTA